MRLSEIAERTFPLLAIVLFFVLWEVACIVFQNSCLHFAETE